MRVNTDRARRYRQRTMAKPPSSYVLTAVEAEWHLDWQEAWIRNADDVPEPPVAEWHRQVVAYCKAKGLRRPSITIDGISPHEDDGRALPTDRARTLRWTAEGDA